MRTLLLLLLLLAAAAPLQARQAKPKAATLPPLVKKSVNAIMAGNPAPLKGYMTPQVEQGLTREVLQTVKQQYVAPLGELRSAAVVKTQTVQGLKVTVFVMHMTRGDLRLSLAETSAGKIAGLHVLPPGQ